MFMEAGYRTGLYTSPHLVRFNERIRVNGREIGDADLARLVDRLRPAIERTRATFFEATTCIAFVWFAEQAVDVAVVETGLGGRLDATNVITPLVSLITTISLDHTEHLGDTLRSIAREKGGIIKPGVPVVTGAIGGEPQKVLERIARRNGSRLMRAADEVRLVGSALQGRRSTFASRRFVVRGVRPGLDGRHQSDNARLAVAAMSVVLERVESRRRFDRIDAGAVRRGLEHVVRNTGLLGRLQKYGARVVLDVAHNPEGIRTVVEALLERSRRRWSVVFGVMKDKELEPMGAQLARIAEVVFAVRPRTERALPAATLARSLRRLGTRTVAAGSVPEGLQKAFRRDGKILVTGSHYVVGEALESLERRHGHT
jgi:dihydrofolate synthase/folylpolyglutamate synthase